MAEFDDTREATVRPFASWCAEWSAAAIAWMRHCASGGYRAATRAFDRMAHPWRRHRALRRLDGVRAPRQIVVLCYGNVCRSPFAAALLERLVPFPVISAGFLPPGRQVPSIGVAAAAKRGIDLTAHRSRLVTREVIDGADIVVVMDAPQARAVRRAYPARSCEVVLLGDLDPNASAGRVITDPWAKPITEFDDVYARIDRCCQALVSAIR